jgi:hypothetical protein
LSVELGDLGFGELACGEINDLNVEVKGCGKGVPKFKGGRFEVV